MNYGHLKMNRVSKNIFISSEERSSFSNGFSPSTLPDRCLQMLTFLMSSNQISLRVAPPEVVPHHLPKQLLFSVSGVLRRVRSDDKPISICSRNGLKAVKK
ncbi:hypothetical protein NPIL_311011 [Nephila pilipes]|uniref:Uncharacterized protein n=1 Tax=Nephila pilipes TaxID=299642 RepID=A0A8X6TF11_NEPPI|nr:hypothetical protein NPIL_311011 [Nephila pilipes]